MARQCVICEGPIINGRCKLCGMPFKRDAELYHLNEDRTNHMKHASSEAKRIMNTYPEPAKTQAAPKRPANAAKPSGSNWHNKEVRKTGSSMAKEEQKRTKQNQKKGSAAFIYLIVLLFYLFLKFMA